MLSQAAQTARRSPESAATYAAIAQRRGNKIATIAIARKLPTRACHLLATMPGAEADTPAASAAPAITTPRRPGGSPGPGHARPCGMSQATRPALDLLTEQPGPRTHGHGIRQIREMPDGCLPDHSASHAGDKHDPLINQHEGPPSPPSTTVRRSSASSSFVLPAARLRALQLDPSRTAT